MGQLATPALIQLRFFLRLADFEIHWRLLVDFTQGIELVFNKGLEVDVFGKQGLEIHFEVLGFATFDYNVLKGVKNEL